jgi:hypothetical protein
MVCHCPGVIGKLQKAVVKAGSKEFGGVWQLQNAGLRS